MRTQVEIVNEILALEEVKPRVPNRSFFGDNNQKAIEVQLEVLKGYLDRDVIYEEYLDGYILDSALHAIDWMECEVKEAPSEGWREIAE